MTFDADITLLLEGTYPFVRGGVSSCVHQLIRAMPDVSFAIHFIGAQQKLAEKPVFDMPSNVVKLEKTFLFDGIPPEEQVPGSFHPYQTRDFYKVAADFYAAETERERLRRFWLLIDAWSQLPQGFTYANLCRDREAWDILVGITDRFAPDTSFVDFFWTSRFLNLPVWLMLRDLSKVPSGRIYASLCTGYAGLLGSVAAKTRGRNLLITEHGIYTKERVEEINRAEWIYEPEDAYFNYSTEWRKLKDVWVNTFEFIARVAYETCYTITTLHEGNRIMQLEYGAPEHKTHIIPNGIQPEAFDQARATCLEARRNRPGRFVFCFIGRVVPVKDVKTLLRAAQIVKARGFKADFRLFGPTEEDPEYFEECRQMLESLELQDTVHFMGNAKPPDILSDCDAVILTSISEGQPLVILEAFSAGVPTVTTDVGSCRELVYGRNPPDQALGRAGSLTRIGSPVETADALCALMAKPELIRLYGEAGRKRVEAVYLEDLVMSEYRAVFRSMDTEVG